MEVVPEVLLGAALVISAAIYSALLPSIVRWISNRVRRFAPVLDEFEIRFSGVLPVLVRRPQQRPLDEQVDTLIESLREATAVIDAIQSDIRAKQEQAELMKQRAEEYERLASRHERLASLSADQAEAVLAEMESLVGDASAGSNRWTTLMTLVAIALGLLYTTGIGFLFYWLGARVG